MLFKVKIRPAILGKFSTIRQWDSYLETRASLVSRENDDFGFWYPHFKNKLIGCKQMLSANGKLLTMKKTNIVQQSRSRLHRKLGPALNETRNCNFCLFFMRGSNNAYALPADGLPQYHNQGSIEQSLFTTTQYLTFLRN